VLDGKLCEVRFAWPSDSEDDEKKESFKKTRNCFSSINALDIKIKRKGTFWSKYGVRTPFGAISAKMDKEDYENN
ncbi:hypothetical protein TNIN_438721, partial [Trichonephila inaurata madagascariensis]